MKMTGKRILTALLAMVMLFALLPGGAKAAAAEASGVRIVYGFNGIKSPDKDPATGTDYAVASRNQLAALGYTDTNYFWKHYASSITSNDNKWFPIAQNAEVKAFQLGGGTNAVAWYAMEIDVPVAGTYTAKVDGIIARKTAYGLTDIFLVPVDEWTNIDTVWADADNKWYLGASTHNDTTTATAYYDETDIILKENVELEKGKYIVVYYKGKQNTSAKNGTSYLYMATAAPFILDGGNGSAIMGGIISAESAEIATGSSTTVTATGYNSQTGNAIDTFTYTSQNTAIATVEGNTVTAVAPGTATIQATAEGYVGALTTEITVPDPYNTNVTAKYDFAGVMKKYETDNSYDYSDKKLSGNLSDVFSEANAHGFFSYSTASQTNIGDDEIKSNYGDLQIKNGHWLTFEINVPVKGKYVFTQNFKGNSGDSWNSDVSVYIKNSKPEGAEYGTLVGSYNCKTDGGTNKYFDKQLNTEPLQMDAGKWYVTYSVGGNTNAFVYALTLTSGNGGSVLMGDLSTDKAEIAIGETATVTGGYDSATAAAASGVTYSSLNTNIATVDASTGVVTAVDPGTATIQATAEGYGGVLTTQVTVKAPEASIDSHSVKLDGILGMNIYVQDIPESAAENYKIRFTVEGNAAQELTGKKQQDGRYCFTGKVCASEMSKTLTVQLYKADALIEEKEYTIKEYLEKQKEKGIETLTALADALLAYGNHAAYKKGYITTAPAAPVAPNLEGYTYTGAGTGVKLSAFIDDACDFRISFPDTYGSYTLSVDGADKGLISSLNGKYSIDEIPGEFWGDQHTFKVMNGDQEIYNQSRSVMNYLANYITNHADDTVNVNLMKAMWHYSTAAVAYKEYLAQQ